MNVFRFIDETIRGVVLFVFDYVSSTWTLVRHPLVGPAKLYRADRRPGLDQISSLTYLALSAFVSLLIVNAASDGRRAGEVLPTAVMETLRTLSGGGTASFLPSLAGALAATAVLAAIPRLLAAARGLDERRRDYFVKASEYATGVSLILLAIVVSILSSLMGDMDQVDDFSAGMAKMFGYNMLVTGLYFYAGVLLSIQFWSGLLRSARPQRVIRMMAATWRPLKGTRWLSLGAWRQHMQLRKQMQNRLAGLAPDAKLGWLQRQRRLLRVSFLLMGGFVAPLVILAGALAGAAFTAQWVVRQELAASEPALGFLSVACLIQPEGSRASAVVWNSSDEPAEGWIGSLGVKVVFWSADGQEDAVFAYWKPAAGRENRSDLLLPRASMEIEGPLVLPDEAQALMRTHTSYGCAIDPDFGAR